MNKCSICGTEQKEIGKFSFKLGNEDDKSLIAPYYNIQLITMIKGKEICNKCMHVYYKIDALWGDKDFSCGGVQYFADGRNLE